MVDLIGKLDEAYPATDSRRSWLFVTDTIMQAHGEQAVLLYSRSS
jgi:hypothetical protein